MRNLIDVRRDREDYVKYLIAGRTEKCIQIENKYDLFGYTPELVSIGFTALAEGKDAHAAIDDYCNQVDV
jgi:hypothetical protein